MKKLENSDIWEKASKIRREQIDSGLDISFNKIFLPIYINHIRNSSFKSLLDVGSGTGHLAREISKYVEHVVAIEPSFGMYSVAKEVLADTTVKLENLSSFEYKADQKFDIVISHMCAHTTPDLNGFLRSLSQLVAFDGEIVVSVPHPCFYEMFKKYFGGNFNYMDTLHSNVSLNISLDAGRSMPDLPFFHRPLEKYMEAFKTAGLMVTNITEPWPSIAVMNSYPKPWKYPKYCFFYAIKHDK